MSFTSAEGKRFSKIQYRKSQKFFRNGNDDLLIADDRFGSLGLKESPQKRYYSKVKDLRNKFARFEKKVQRHDDIGNKKFAELDAQFCKLMCSAREMYTPPEDCEKVISVREIQHVVWIYLDMLFLPTSRSHLCGAILAMFSEDIIEEDRITEVFLEGRTMAIRQVLDKYKMYLSWHNRYITFIIQPIEKALFTSHYATLQEHYRKKVT